LSLDFLYSLERLGMKFGLENMARICAALGHPEASFRSVIVAGTNGKGSVTAMLSAALHAAGYRSARYTSPHLERIEERFVIDEREVETGELEAAAATVQSTVERLVAHGVLETLPTFFECATAIAFELFRRAGVEIAVVEVGLGGRLDATNVVTPMAAVITSIDFDHRDLLGDTLEAIAREKAGVIKPGVPVIVGPVGPGPRGVIASIAAERGAPLTYVDHALKVRTSGGRASFDGVVRLSDVALALEGQHQLANAGVALATMSVLVEMGVGVEPEAMRAGLERAKWPGRLERFRWHDADVLIDAAHNPAGARALATFLAEAGWNELTLVVGVMRDKDVRGVLEPLLPHARAIVCTTPPNPRALPASELVEIVRSMVPGTVEVLALSEPDRAVRHACAPGARVVVAGSIFLLGAVRGILR
jgi:dihydrofolate synthase/folylpolyglutamate synthase